MSTHERTDRRYAAAFHEYGGTKAKFHLVHPDRSEAAELARYNGWLANTKPDAVLTDFIHSEQWQSPLPHARLMLRPGETGPGVRADFGRVGAEAMRMLDGLLRENRLGRLIDPLSVLIPGIWAE